MSETKTYVFGENANNQNGVLSLLAPMLQQRGIDPNVLALMRNNDGFGGEGSWFIWIIFLFFIFGWGNNGMFGNNNNNAVGDAALGNLISNNNGRDLLMQAIQGNANALSSLATTLNTSVDQVTAAVNAVSSQVQNVGNQVGQSSLQIINALQNGNMQIAQQISQGFCDNRLTTCQQTNTLQTAINNVENSVDRNFATINYNTQRQTCDITNAIKESTATIVAGQTAAEMRELNRDISERDRKIAELNNTIVNGQQSAMFAQTASQMIAPINAALAAVQTELTAIKGQLPSTTVLPYSPVTAVPTYVAAQYGYGNTNPWS